MVINISNVALSEGKKTHYLEVSLSAPNLQRSNGSVYYTSNSSPEGLDLRNTFTIRTPMMMIML